MFLQLMVFLQGMDLKNVTLLVQFCAPQSFNSLMQRFGRAARNMSITATCVLLMESGYFYDERLKRIEAPQKKRKKEAITQSASVSKNNKTTTSLGRVRRLSAIPENPNINDAADVDEALYLLATHGRKNTRQHPVYNTDNEDNIPTPTRPEASHNQTASSDSAFTLRPGSSNSEQRPAAQITSRSEEDNGKLACDYVAAPAPTKLALGVKRKRPEPFALEEALDHFINSECLPASNSHSNCRRKVIDDHYGNNRICELIPASL